MSNWWKRNENIPYENPNYIAIVDFYQHKCPVIFKNSGRVANRGVDFKKRGWNKDSIKTLLSKMKHNNGNTIKYDCVDGKNTKVEDRMKELECYDTGFNDIVVFIENSEIYKTQSIFYAIRNAIAHSSFSVVTFKGQNIYYLESAKGDNIKAQMRLTEATLLHWIKLFNTPVSKLQKVKSKNKIKKQGGLKSVA